MSAKTLKRVKNSKKSVKPTLCSLMMRKEPPMISMVMQEWADSARRTFLTISTLKIYSVALDLEEIVAGVVLALKAYLIFSDLEVAAVTDLNRAMSVLYEMKITLEEAAHGLEDDIQVPHKKTCPRCNGSKAEPGTESRSCDTCGGSGQVRHVQNTPLGQFATIRPCNTCHGEGKIIDSPCQECHGRGIVKQKSTINVKIPPGVEDGSRLRVPGEGDVGKRGGPPGDLYVLIRVKPHKYFKREGANLHYQKPISFVQATLGDKVEVPTIDGTVELKIPEGTQTGTSFRIKGFGMPHLRWNGKGNLYVKVKVVTPKKLSPRQKELLEEFADISGDEIYNEEKGFFDKVKDAISH